LKDAIYAIYMARFKKVWSSIRTAHGQNSALKGYAFESWTLSMRDIESLMAFEMKCYRIILHIHWQQKITNKAKA